VLFTFEVRAGGSVKDFNVINVGRSVQGMAMGVTLDGEEYVTMMILRKAP
jgi:hypothetical protein